MTLRLKMNSILFVTHENLAKTAVANSMFAEVIKYLELNNVSCHLLSATDDRKVENTSNCSYFYRSSYGKVDLKSFLQFIKSYKLFYRSCKGRDGVFFRSYPSMLLFSFFARLLRKKVIFDTRGLFFEELVDSGKINKKYRKLFYPLEYLLLLISSRVICVTDAQKNYYIKNFSLNKDKFQVIHNGAPANKLHSDVSNTDSLRLCYVGSLVKWHAPELVSDFCVELYKRNISFSLDVITRDIENAKLFFSEIENVNIYSHNYRDKPIKFDFGFCFIKGGVSKEVCYPVKFNEYLNSGTKVLALDSVQETTKIINSLKCGVIFNKKCNVETMVDEFLSKYKYVNEITTLPNELDFSEQCKLVLDVIKKF